MWHQCPAKSWPSPLNVILLRIWQTNPNPQAWWGPILRPKVKTHVRGRVLFWTQILWTPDPNANTRTLSNCCGVNQNRKTRWWRAWNWRIPRRPWIRGSSAWRSWDTSRSSSVTSRMFFPSISLSLSRHISPFALLFAINEARVLDG